MTPSALQPAQDRPYKQIDVFTGTPYLGNPLAVVLDGSNLSDADMQRFARWTNLSETTFVLPPTQPDTDYRVRIFTPGGELPFAGHPTLGTCHAWLQAGGKPKAPSFIVQECQAGLVNIRREGNRLAFGAPPLKRTAPGPALLAQIAKALGLKAPQIRTAQMLDNGTAWLGLLLDSPQTVLELTPNFLELKNLGHKVGVVGVESAPAATGLIARSNREARAFTSNTGTASTAPEVEVRGFAPHMGINEDPVTGSLNASLAQWLIAEGHAPERYIAAQGTCMDRAGRVYIERDASGQVWVGGESVTCIDGTVTL
jgi:PhzF family phenazine biosynthesis protein